MGNGWRAHALITMRSAAVLPERISSLPTDLSSPHAHTGTRQACEQARKDAGAKPNREKRTT